MADLQSLSAAIEAGDRKNAVRLTSEAIAEGVAPRTILDAMSGAMAAVGQRFQANEIYVPEMLISARAMKEATAVLEPVLIGAGIRPEWTAVIGTIEGDLHDIGKNLVAMMWRGANIEVVDLGTNVPAQRFAEAAREHNARLVGVSALLTTTMVGGAPVTPEYATQIGADAYAPDAALRCRLRRPERPAHRSADISRVVQPLLPADQRRHPRAHDVDDVQALRRQHHRADS